MFRPSWTGQLVGETHLSGHLIGWHRRSSHVTRTLMPHMISRCVSPFVPLCLSCLVLSSQIFIVFMSRGFCHCRVIYGPWESRRSRWLKVHHVRNPHSHHFPDAAGVDDDNLTLDRTTYLEPHILMEAKLQGIKFDVRSLVFCPKSFSYSHLFICQKSHSCQCLFLFFMRTSSKSPDT